MKTLKKILFAVFVLTALGFSQVKTTISKQDSTDLATIANQFNEVLTQLQKDEQKVRDDKAFLFDKQNEYNSKLKAIQEKKKQ